METTKMKPEEIESGLSQFIGTENYYKVGWMFPKMVFTDGINFLVKQCGAYWLLDAICSHQPKCMKDDMLQCMQFWTLKKEEDDWVLTCDRDQGDEAFRQVIGYSDFPLESIRIWVAPADEQNCLMYLPSEH